MLIWFTTYVATPLGVLLGCKPLPEPAKALALLPFSFLLYFFLLPWLLQGLAPFLLPSLQHSLLSSLNLLVLSILTHSCGVPLGWFFLFLLLRVSPHWPQWQNLLGLYWQGPLKEKALQVIGLLLAQAVLMAGFNVFFYNELTTVQTMPWQGWPKEAALLMSLLALAVAPVMEEGVFRGWLQGLLTKPFNAEFAMIVSSLLFALLHGGYFTHPIALLYVLALGVLYSFWREKTGSIWPGVVAHTVNNVVALLQGHA